MKIGTLIKIGLTLGDLSSRPSMCCAGGMQRLLLRCAMFNASGQYLYACCREAGKFGIGGAHAARH